MHKSKHFSKIHPESRLITQLSRKKVSFEKISISSDSEKKSKICKEYIEKMYQELFFNMESRSKRLDIVKEELANSTLSENEKKQKIFAHYKQESEFLRAKRKCLDVGQFHIISKIGQGGYADVFLCKKKETDELYALKRMKKQFIFERNQVNHIKLERDFLAFHSSEWIVKLFSSFQDDLCLYLVLEYIQGGDLKTLLSNLKILDEKVAVFYFAEMIVCLEEIHNFGLIHRDIKPENYLIDKDGHLKLTDFGLSADDHLYSTKLDDLIQKNLEETKSHIYTISPRKRNHQALRKWHQKRRQKSFVGSPGYVAPEIILQKQYGKEVDLWSLGCILYEMLAGFTPFAGRTDTETLENVVNFKQVLEFPDYDDEEPMTDEAWDLIKILLSSQEKRTKINLETTIKAHPFFKGIKWDSLRQMDPPFVPKLKNETDISYFDTTYFRESKLPFPDSQQDPKIVEMKKANLNQLFSGFAFQRFPQNNNERFPQNNNERFSEICDSNENEDQK
ncbi:cell cycle protein kinase dbf2-related [Anaeramoeba ignava]|uniref:non-specific serine/threonine protein kinase n=1 Tax=Anaeramoeba ignava TaxID=1746090 RepID=A0A9Q0LDE2_ANAIG|nr:cell cycle protein kinase dbf2-related [Anaeramoeba ignava]